MTMARRGVQTYLCKCTSINTFAMFLNFQSAMFPHYQTTFRNIGGSCVFFWGRCEPDHPPPSDPATAQRLSAGTTLIASFSDPQQVMAAQVTVIPSDQRLVVAEYPFSLVHSLFAVRSPVVHSMNFRSPWHLLKWKGLSLRS